MDFSISTLSRDGDAAVVIKGELDVATVAQFLEAVDSCLESNPRRLLVEASGVSFLASIGAEALLVAAARCHRANAEFALDSSPRARQTLDLLDLWWLGVLDDGLSIEVEVGEEAIWQPDQLNARARGSSFGSRRPGRPAPYHRRDSGGA